MKVYILQKEIPDGKVGDRYYLSPSNKEEYYNRERETRCIAYPKWFVETHPDWFFPIEDDKEYHFQKGTGHEFIRDYFILHRLNEEYEILKRTLNQ